MCSTAGFTKAFIPSFRIFLRTPIYCHRSPAQPDIRGGAGEAFSALLGNLVGVHRHFGGLPSGQDLAILGKEL
ncbi:MAG: hypothetical protein Q8L49_06670, partial [Burkholderiaceae bacterium]|nr:hypothetical protein [Burkholderiaceae bacterium]